MTVAELKAALADLPDWAVVEVGIEGGGCTDDDAVDHAPLGFLHYRAGILTLDTA